MLLRDSVYDSINVCLDQRAAGAIDGDDAHELCDGQRLLPLSRTGGRHQGPVGGPWHQGVLRPQTRVPAQRLGQVVSNSSDSDSLSATKGSCYRSTK